MSRGYREAEEGGGGGRMGEEGEGKYPRYQPDTLAKGPGVHREGVTFPFLLLKLGSYIVPITLKQSAS